LHPWNRFEQYFKHNQLRLLQKWLGMPELDPDQFSAGQVRHILVVRQHDQLGDFLLSTPVFKALHDHFPGRTITLVARKYTAMLAQHNPYIDQVLTFYEHGRDWSLQGIRKLTTAVWNKFDLTVVLNTVSHSLTSDLIARFCCKKYVLGSSHLLFGGTTENFFYNLRAPYALTDRHQSERNLDILNYIGVPIGDKREQLFLTAAEKKWAADHLYTLGRIPQRPLLMIHPGAGKPGNRWPVAAFAEAANRLSRSHHVQLAASWGPAEEALGRELVARIDSPVIVTVHRDLRKLAALFNQATLFLCNDTGVMHMAAAVATPLVAVFGPTDPRLWKPWGDFFIAVRSADEKCQSVAVDLVCNSIVKLLDNIKLGQ
jgi:heptosyltransferase II